MVEDVRAAAERLLNATNLADDSLTDFEADVKAVARFALEAVNDRARLLGEVEALKEALEQAAHDLVGVGYYLKTYGGDQVRAGQIEAVIRSMDAASAATTVAGEAVAPGASDAGDGGE